MGLSDEHRERLLVSTRNAAGAFTEDMDYLREIASRRDTSKREIRHVSATLRKMIVDRDTAKIATPRLEGKLTFTSPDNRVFYRISEEHPYLLFLSGGANVLGGRVDRMAVFDAPAWTGPNRIERLSHQRMPSDKAFDMVQLNTDQFAQQKVLCWRGRWISRQTAIKYLAEISHGVHSDTPTDPDDIALAQIRSSSSVKIGQDDGLHFDLFKHGMDATDVILDYDPDVIDLVLIEILAAATLITISPMVQRLEAIVRTELGLRAADPPPQTE